MTSDIEKTQKILKTVTKRKEKSLLGILNDRIPAYTEYSKVHLFTNESIINYIDLTDNCTSALTVLSSGDHMLNLIAKGITNIDTFDINIITKYYALGLKLAMVRKYSYKNFLEISKILLTDSNEKVTSVILESLLPYMDYHSKYFWERIIAYNKKLQKRFKTNHGILELLSIEPLKKYTLENNYYLQDENTYTTLKEHLNTANITFQNLNILTSSKIINKQYDCIMLSNCPDYFYRDIDYEWEYKFLIHFENNLDSILNENGIVFLNYIFNYDKTHVINNSSVLTSMFQNKEYVYEFDESEYLGSGVLIYKKTR